MDTPVRVVASSMPANVATAVHDFRQLTPSLRLEMLLELGDHLPEPPDAIRDQMETVTECQSPLGLATTVAPEEPRPVRIYLWAPQQSPTARGFAGLLHRYLNGQPATTCTAMPHDLPHQLGLTEVVSPLRIAGMQGLVRRLRHQVAVALSSGNPTASNPQEHP